MLVMAGAALDAMLKRLLADVYGVIVMKNKAARDKAAEHLHRQVLKRIDSEGQRLASSLLSDNPMLSLMQLVVEDLTSQSLQSVNEIQKIAAYLGLEKQKELDDLLNKAKHVVADDSNPSARVRIRNPYGGAEGIRTPDL